MAVERRSARFTLSSAVGLRIEKAADSNHASAVQEGPEQGSVRSVYGGVRRQQALGGQTSTIRASVLTSRVERPHDRKWHIVDADGLVVGRAAMVIANVLRGKHKASFASHVDCGDGVVVINAEKIRFSTEKSDKKIYYKHAAHARWLKSATAVKAVEGRFPERVLEKAIERMIPRGPLGREQMRNLRIFRGAGPTHGLEDRQVLDVASMPRKHKFKG